MRERPEWMSLADYIILRTLADSELELTPAVLAKNLDLSRPHVSDRLSILVDHDLATKPERGYYRITDRGRAYLRGELDAAALEPDDDEG